MLMKKLLLFIFLSFITLQINAQEILFTEKIWDKGGVSLKVPANLSIVSETKEEYQLESDDLFFLIGRSLNDPITYRQLAQSFWELLDTENGKLLSEFSSSTNEINTYFIIGSFSLEGETALVYVIGVENDTPKEEDYLIVLMLRDMNMPTEESDKVIEEILKSIVFL